MQRPKTTLLILFSLILLTLQGCDPIGGIGDFFETLFSANVMIIRGIKTISGEGEVLTIQPGTTIKFKEETFVNVGGELLFKDGAKFVCQGTAEEPIVFENVSVATGKITLSETANIDSIIEYCTINNSILFNISQSSITIRYNKFIGSNISLCKSSSPNIIYNSFDGNSELIELIWGGGSYAGVALIEYNTIENTLSKGILIGTGGDYGEGRSVIRYNLIEDCGSHAIWWYNEDNENNKLTISNNYINNCNGKAGVDLTGEQSYNVTYSSPSDIPIQNAGCGW